MKVSQELKDEFENLRSVPNVTMGIALNIVGYQQNGEYEKLADFLFENDTPEEDNQNQLQFAKWWTGEEEIEVEEELYYLELPFDWPERYVNLNPDDGGVFPSDKKERYGTRTKFTAEEIENNEKLRQFEKFKKRVDDDV